MRILLALVPILTFPFLWAIFYKRLEDWRSSFLAASILWATFVIVITELLSAVQMVRAASVLVLWTLALVPAVLYAVRLIGDPHSLLKGFHWPQCSPFELFLLGACGVIIIITGLIAWIAPPNAYDSLAYHLPKVMHWIQDRNVAFYPTHILRQVHLAPGAEYIILHLHILAASDRLDNLVEWFSMIGSALGVSLIAAQLGAGRRAQLLSAVAALTIPAGILQASSTQTDFISSFWLVCFVSWMLQLREKWGWLSVAAAGASLGLAALTKATTYIFALPFLAWFAVSLLRKYGLRTAGLGAAVLIFLVINVPTFIRSEQLFGNPLGITTDGTLRPPVSYKYSNDVFSAAELTSNVVRNIGSHLGTPSELLNLFFERQIIQIHRLIGMSVNDPRTTWAQYHFYVFTPSYLEARDGNFLHLVFIALSAIVILRHPRRYRVWIPYGLCLLAGFLIFSLYLRWQPYGARLQLPLFVLYAAPLGKVGEDIRPRWVGGGVAVILLAGSVPWLLLNDARPLIGSVNILNTDRSDLYLWIPPSPLKASYIGALDFIASHKCSRLGIYMDTNDWEYPLWVLLQQRTGEPVAVESVDVQNISRLAAGPYQQFKPCAIFARAPTPSNAFTVDGQRYDRAWISPLASVYLRRKGIQP